MQKNHLIISFYILPTPKAHLIVVNLQHLSSNIGLFAFNLFLFLFKKI